VKQFAKPRNQARKAVSRVLALGQPRHGNNGDGKIHSVGTARTYEQSLKLAVEWDRANGGNGINSIDRDRAIAYLTDRAKQVTQKTLDRDRQALQILPGLTDIPRFRSDVRTSGHGDRGRAYTATQITMVAAAQDGPNRLATEIAAAAGLRAHELFTLRPLHERPASTHRTWSADRFVGLHHVIRYTVVGKGGLVREVAIPVALAERLEVLRLPEPRQVTDRSVHYDTRYDLRGGHAWSQSYSDAAKRVLGWSTGAHGIRHTYAQIRLKEIQSRSYDYEDALEIVSQELGHFRPDITEVYLR
jgi:integrase